MRIAVSGPQNTGKTTFVRDFLSNFEGYSTPNKPYREVVKELGLPINQGTDEMSQRAILEHLYQQIVEHEGKNIIFDRCVVDNYAYTCAAYAKGNVSKEFLLATKRKMFEHLPHLDCILFIPTAAGVKLTHDGVRDIDVEFIDTINRIFVETLFDIGQRTHLPVFVVTGNRKERIRLVREHIF